jgi:hypothetical protein
MLYAPSISDFLILSFPLLLSLQTGSGAHKTSPPMGSWDYFPGSKAAYHRGGPGSILGQSMWDLWWTKWHWDKFFSEYFGFPLSISFHRCSITTKRTKKIIIIIIVTTGLHKKPQGCGASVASAAGPFTTKKKWPMHKINKSCQPSAEVKNVRSLTSTLLVA